MSHKVVEKLPELDSKADLRKELKMVVTGAVRYAYCAERELRLMR